jgi:hypothetical protein
MNPQYIKFDTKSSAVACCCDVRPLQVFCWCLCCYRLAAAAAAVVVIVIVVYNSNNEDDYDDTY